MRELSPHAGEMTPEFRRSKIAAKQISAEADQQSSQRFLRRATLAPLPTTFTFERFGGMKIEPHLNF